MAVLLLHGHAAGAIVLRRQTFGLPPAAIRHDTKACYHVDLGHGDWMSAQNGPSRAQVLEDGEPLALPNRPHQDVQERGRGRFLLWNGQLQFSASDGSDPRISGRRYEVRWPLPIARPLILAVDVMALAAVVLVVWLRRARGAERVPIRASTQPLNRYPLAAATMVGLIALALRLAVYREMSLHPSRFIDGALVVGVPFSDAMQWEVLGEGLARGEGLVGGWSARRPFYAIFLAMLYAWSGPSAAVGIIANLLLGALTAGIICRLGWRLVHPVVGLAAGLAFAFDGTAIECALTTLSETLGLSLFVLSLHWLAMGAGGRRDALVGSGLALALSSLTRPVAVLAEGVLAILVVGPEWRRRTAWTAAALFVLGFAVGVGPWLVRQRVVHGIASLSDNSAAVLYAVSSPVHRTWSSAVDREADAAGVSRDIRSRHLYFAGAFLRNLRERPSAFIENSLTSLRWAIEGLVRIPWTARLFSVLALATVGVARMRSFEPAVRAAGWALACGLLVVGILALPGRALLWIAMGGVCVIPAVKRVRAAWIPAVALATTFVGLAISGLGGEPRMVMTANWLIPLGLSTAALAALNVVGALLGRASWVDDLHPDAVLSRLDGWLRQVARVLTLGIVGWVGLTGAYLAVRSMSPAARPSSGVPSLAEEERILDIAERARPGLFTAAEREHDFQPYRTIAGEALDKGQGRLVVVRALVDRHRYWIPGGLESAHWSRMFSDRNYERTFFYMDGRLADGTAGPRLAIVDGHLPPLDASRPALLVGRLNVDSRFPYEEELLEVLALVPPGTDGYPDWARASVARDPEHVARLFRIRPPHPGRKRT